MSNNNAAILGTIAIVSIVSLLVLAWGAIVYNNSQNIARDQFIAQHCQQVSKIDTDNGFTTGAQYKCGVAK